MQKKNQQKRREEIEQTAYDLLDEFGYEGISMLKIARAAKASNETLYRWYGDKKGLFQSLVASNAKTIASQLQSLESQTISTETIQHIGEQLLTMLVSRKAIALNKAAAGDPSGDLGRALATHGRQTIMPLMTNIFDQFCKSQNMPNDDDSNFADIYIRLLVGDLQIRRTTNALSKFTQKDISKRVAETNQLIIKLIRV